MCSNYKSEFGSPFVHVTFLTEKQQSQLTDTVLIYRSGKILASTSTCIQGHNYTAEVKDIASPQPVYRESTSWPF